MGKIRLSINNDGLKKNELGSLNQKDLKKILDYYDSKVPITGVDESLYTNGRYATVNSGDVWVDNRKPNIDDKNGKVKWTRIDLKKLLNKKKVPEVMYISNGYVAYKVKGDMYSHWRVGDLYMLNNDVIRNVGRYNTNRGFELLNDDDEVKFTDIIQGRANTKEGYWTSGWKTVKEAFDDWYNGKIKTYHGEYRDNPDMFGTSMKSEKQKRRFESYKTPERLLNFDVQNQYPIGRDEHEGQINSVDNFSADVWREAFAGADSYEVFEGGLSDPFYNVQWWPSKGGDFQFTNDIPFYDAFGLITYEDIINEFKGTPIGYMAERQNNVETINSYQNIAEILFGKSMDAKKIGKKNYAVSSKLRRNIATFPEDENARGESINFAQNIRKSKNKDGTRKNKLQWKNNRAVIFNPNSTFQFARTFGNKKGQKIRYVSRKAGDGLVIWREQGFARLAAENARKKGYLIRTVPVAGGYVNLMAKRKHYYKGQEWFDEIQHGYTEENRKYLEKRGIPADDRKTRYPRGKANDYYRRLRR
tara:strand:+ start:5044 stop:6636 length:1593 start_codon:yes stop_codon:yes gene_type:complete